MHIAEYITERDNSADPLLLVQQQTLILHCYYEYEITVVKQQSSPLAVNTSIHISNSEYAETY